MSAPANLQPDNDIWTTVNWVVGEPRLVCCVCDNYQQARATPCFLLQPMQYSPVCGHTSSQCFDEGDRSNWADRWFHGTRVGTRVGHTVSKYPGINIPNFRYRTTLVSIIDVAKAVILKSDRTDNRSVYASYLAIRLCPVVVFTMGRMNVHFNAHQ